MIHSNSPKNDLISTHHKKIFCHVRRSQIPRPNRCIQKLSTLFFTPRRENFLGQMVLLSILLIRIFQVQLKKTEFFTSRDLAEFGHFPRGQKFLAKSLWVKNSVFFQLDLSSLISCPDHLAENLSGLGVKNGCEKFQIRLFGQGNCSVQV